MTIASEISDLQTNLAAAKNAVTTKGGTVGNTGLAGLATEIASIPSGGSSATPWGELSYYSSWAEEFSADQAMWQDCTVVGIDNDVYANWLSEHPQLDSTQVTFRYEEGYDPSTGSPTGEYYWFYDWDNMDKIDPNDLLDITGIAVTGYIGYSYASFVVEKTITVDTTSQIVKAELSQNMYNRLTSSGLDNTGNYYVLGGGLRIYRGAITGFTFGTQPTTTPAGFLNDIPLLTSVDMSHATSLTSIGNTFLQNNPTFNQQLTIPNTVTSIGNGFLQYCTQYNQPVVIPDSVTTIGNYFLASCPSFNSAVTLSNSLTTIDQNFMYNASLFNQPLSIPNTVTSIGRSFLNGCGHFNQPLSLPSGLTFLGSGFLSNCNSMTSTVNFGSLSATIAETSDYTLSTTNSSAACYTTGISIATATIGTITGWLNRFPNRSSSPYRNLTVSMPM